MINHQDERTSSNYYISLFLAQCRVKFQYFLRTYAIMLVFFSISAGKVYVKQVPDVWPKPPGFTEDSKALWELSQTLCKTEPL